MVALAAQRALSGASKSAQARAGPPEENYTIFHGLKHAECFISVATLLAQPVSCFWKMTWNISGFSNKHFQIQCLEQLLFSSHEYTGGLGVSINLVGFG